MKKESRVVGVATIGRILDDKVGACLDSGGEKDASAGDELV